MVTETQQDFSEQVFDLLAVALVVELATYTSISIMLNSFVICRCFVEIVDLACLADYKYCSGYTLVCIYQLAKFCLIATVPSIVALKLNAVFFQITMYLLWKLNMLEAWPP